MRLLFLDFGLSGFSLNIKVDSFLLAWALTMIIALSTYELIRYRNLSFETSAVLLVIMSRGVIFFRWPEALGYFDFALLFENFWLRAPLYAAGLVIIGSNLIIRNREQIKNNTTIKLKRMALEFASELKTARLHNQERF